MIILSRTKWFTRAPTRLRPCLTCGIIFPSTSEGERTCPKCADALDGSRERSAINSQVSAIREEMAAPFDAARLGRNRLAEAMTTVRRFTWQLEHMELSVAVVASHRAAIKAAQKVIGAVNVKGQPAQEDADIQ